MEVDIASGATVAAKPGRVASSETKMHLCVYRNRADVQGVAHAHPPFATAYAVAGMPIETAAYAEMRVLYDRIPVCRYGRPGTEAINADIPAVLKTHDVFLLANHGLTAAAPSAIVAAYRLEGVESIAKGADAGPPARAGERPAAQRTGRPATDSTLKKGGSYDFRPLHMAAVEKRQLHPR